MGNERMGATNEKYWLRNDTAGKIRAQILATQQARAISRVTEAPYVDGYIAGLEAALRIVSDARGAEGTP